MYHIKSDRRSQTSAGEFVRGLQECLQTIPLKNITVSDIHRVTGISRATFYRLFDTPEDVLIYQLDQMMKDTANVYDNCSSQSTAQLMEETIAMGLQNHVFLQALIQNGRHDLLYRYTEENFRKLDSIRPIFPENMDPTEREYVIAHLSMGMVATQVTWAKNGCRETPKDLVRYLKRYADVVSRMGQEE
ncbi:MAG: TetR/AcrR family transcriptional regulator [Firmicutes bacterium]|nr:TetR/AcrR family transcriptional regulator [Bacillota bacterium]